MSKGLEALKKIKWKLEDEGILGEEYELCDVIEKELKALVIIRDKKVDAGLFEYDYRYGRNSFKLTQEEYDLLKEVLK